MSLTYEEVINSRLKEKQENINKIEKLKSIIEEMNGIAYSVATKARINQIANQLMAENRDYRGALIKNALKKELPKKIIMVCNINIENFEKHNERLDSENEKTKDKAVIAEKREIAEKLSEKVYKYKEEYIRGFPTISEGIRQWDCLIDLVEDSYVLEKDLIDYGIDLNIPPEKF
jgi:hypothetical protein